MRNWSGSARKLNAKRGNASRGIGSDSFNCRTISGPLSSGNRPHLETRRIRTEKPLASAGWAEPQLIRLRVVSLRGRYVNERNGFQLARIQLFVLVSRTCRVKDKIANKQRDWSGRSATGKR